MNYDNILKLANDYKRTCVASLLKIAVIKKLPNGKYRVLSHKGKNLGTYTTETSAKKRLKQIEFFKHLDSNNVQDENNPVIDLTDVKELSYSAFLRKLRQNAPKDCVKEFLILYNNEFNRSIKNELQKPEIVALQNSLVEFNKKHKIKLNKDIVKNAAVTELGDPRLVGKYLSDIIKFTLTRISPEKRPHSLQNLKNKIYNLNQSEISYKKLPPSSAIGQSITFIKHVLFGHDLAYVKAVIANIVNNL